MGSLPYHPAHESRGATPPSHQSPGPQAPPLSPSPAASEALAQATHSIISCFLAPDAPTRMNRGGREAREKQEKVPHHYINTPDSSAMARAHAKPRLAQGWQWLPAHAAVWRYLVLATTLPWGSYCPVRAHVAAAERMTMTFADVFG